MISPRSGSIPKKDYKFFGGVFFFLFVRLTIINLLLFFYGVLFLG